MTSLPPETSVHIMRELGASQKDLAFEMSRVSEIPQDMQQRVLDEFLNQSDPGQKQESEGTITFTSPFTPAGEEDSAYATSSKPKPLGLLRTIDPMQLYSIIRKEHPQTIALILKYLQRDKASVVLLELPKELQAEVTRRLAEIGKVSPDILNDIEKILEEKFYSLIEEEPNETDGSDALVEILSYADRDVEQKILSGLSERNPRFAEDIKKNRLHDFLDLANIDDESLMQVLRLTDLRDLTTALKGATPNIAQRVFNLLGADTATALKEDIESLGQIQFDEIRSAQQQIRNILRGLVTLGKIKFK